MDEAANSHAADDPVCSDINTKAVGIEAGVDAGLTRFSDHWVLKLILSRDFCSGVYKTHTFHRKA
jgi:hypothetical protein